MLGWLGFRGRNRICNNVNILHWRVIGVEGNRCQINFLILTTIDTHVLNQGGRGRGWSGLRGDHVGVKDGLHRTNTEQRQSAGLAAQIADRLRLTR